jgi:hypothetical protein
MKKLFVSILLAVGLGGSAFAQFQPTPVINPLNGNQGLYIDSNFHSVPYFLSYPNSGVTTVVFDPSTSATDQNRAFRHLSRASSANNGESSPMQSLNLPAIVNTVYGVQESRLGVDFSVNNGGSGATLATIPFPTPTYLQTLGNYHFRAVLYVAAGAGGSKVDFGGTSSPVSVVAQITAIGSTAILYASLPTAYLSGPAGSSSTATTQIVIEGTVVVNTGGTFVIQFAQNAANAANSTVKAGSTLTVWQIP